MDTSTERDLIDQVQARSSRKAVLPLLEALQDRVYNVRYQVLHHPQDADDAIHSHPREGDRSGSGARDEATPNPDYS